MIANPVDNPDEGASQRWAENTYQLDGSCSFTLTQHSGLGMTLVTIATVSNKNWVQESRYSRRGSIVLFAPMVEFNEMAEVGETPP